MSRKRVEFYRDAAGDHRWRIKARNGRIIGASTEGYRSKRGARDNLWSLAVILDSGIQGKLL